MLSYLKNLLGYSRPAHARRPAQGKLRGRVRLGLETLEERQLLTVNVPTPIPTPGHLGYYTLKATTMSPSDTFQLDAPAAGAPTLYFDGIQYMGFNLNLIDHFIFEGAGGTNKATLNVHGAGLSALHPKGYDLDLYGDHGHLQEAKYDLKLEQIPTIIANGDADGVADLYGSKSATNRFEGSPTSSSMVNVKASDQANGFGLVHGWAGDSYAGAFGTPQDGAVLVGSTSSENHFVLAANASGGNSSYAGILFNTGSGTISYAVGFHDMLASAGTSSDIVDLRGSTKLASTFTSYGINGDGRTYSVLAANNEAYYFETNGCGYVGAVAGTKLDKAVLYGSTTSQNILTNGPTGVDALGRSDVHLKSNVHSDEVVGFMQVVAVAGTPTDHAVLVGPIQQMFAFMGHTIRRVHGPSPGGPSLTYDIYAVDFS
jgi:hypothetical protein